ncbi:MAG: penicillin-binding protein [Bacteroidales bacterium]|nr:penicillin-binding protein [Bacteroidales bacterium]
MAKHSEPQKKGNPVTNYFIVTILFSLIGLAIMVKAIQISFVEGDFWRHLGELQKQENIAVLPNRGNIYSCNGELMATSVPRYYVYIDFKADGLKKDTLDKYVGPLSAALSKKFGDKTPQGYKAHILKGYSRQSRGYLLISRKISYSELKDIRKFPFLNMRSNRSGMVVKKMVQRQKPFGTLASRTIGDIYGEYEKGGKNGLELQYDSLLRGIPGRSTRRKIGRRWINVVDVEPVNGMDITSTIDEVIQDITEKSLLDKLKEIDAESGTAVVMEVETGEIKAITNMGRIREGLYTETKNYAVADESEPGSTFKVASMIVALEEGYVHPGDTVDTGNGIYMYAGARMTDHNAHKGGYHRITAEQAIWYSSNIGVAKIILKGFEKNPERYVQRLKDMGLDTPLNLEIPGAGRAKIKDPSNKSWWKTTLPWMSFGYETQIPPIYTLTFFNAIANDGKMIKPFFTKSITSPGGDVIKTFHTEVINPSICSSSTLKLIRQMLLDVVDKGTGSAVKSEFIPLAGKTGTAQISQGAAGYTAGGKSHQVSFCGYFPANDPKYSCIVVIRRPRIGYPSGGTMSGGVFKNIAEKVYAANVRLEPDELQLDSSLTKLPVVKGGSRKAVDYVVNKLDIDYESEGNSEWVHPYTDSTEVVLKPLKVIENLVPSVIGMGAKEAVYLLEKSGLRVHLSGRGTVTSQSLSPGVKVSKGRTITIWLN